MPDGLFERDGELARIDELLAAARAGRGRLLVVTGPAGIGKTSLVEAARERADRAGMTVLAARCGELEGSFSFGVARQLFEPLLARAGTAGRKVLLGGAARRAMIAIGGGAGAKPPAANDALFAVVHGLYWLLVNASVTGPVLVAVDDLQWADQASLRFVSYLSARLEGLPVALAGSWRAGEPGSASDRLAQLEEAGPDSTVRPAALGNDGVRAVLSGAFGSVPGERFVAACHAATGGSPFLLRELACRLRADGIGPGDEAANRVASLGPRSVARSVVSRVARLGPAAVGLAQAVAVLGDEAQLHRAAMLAGITVAEAAAAADGMAGMEVLEPGTTLRFAHPIVRAAVYEDIPQADRSMRHASAARLLAAEGADLEQVCAHLLACAPAGSAEVVRWLRAAAARALARGAPENAGAYLRRALAETLDVRVRAGLLHELGRAEALMREPAAADHLGEALNLATSPARRAEIAHDLAELLLLAGRWDTGATVVQEALSDLEAAGQAHGAIAARLWAWWAGFAAFDPRRVDEFDRSWDTLLTAARDETPASRLLAAVLADKLVWRGEQLGQARELLDHALGGGNLLAHAGSDRLLASQAMFAAIFLDELAQAEGLASRLLDVSRSRGSVVGVSIATCVRATVQVRRGDLVGAETGLRALADIAAEHGVTFAIPQALYWGADALIERPELADLAALATAGVDQDLEPTMFGAMLAEVRGRLALAGANLPAASAQLRAAAGIYQSLHVSNPNLSCWRSALALAIAGEDRAQALRFADRELADAERLGLGRPRGIALRTRGVITGGDQGLRDLREATEVLGSSYARLEHARALVELGAALRRANQRTAAREPLRAGLDLAHRCGSTRLAQRAAAELLATGARPRRVVLTGLEALTASERRVAELAAAGMSNPQIAQALFVTLNTVETHLRHAYQKLSISSRGELAAALRSPAPADTRHTVLGTAP